MPGSTRISLIHAPRVAIDPFETAFWAEVDTIPIPDEGLAASTSRRASQSQSDETFRIVSPRGETSGVEAQAVTKAPADNMMRAGPEADLGMAVLSPGGDARRAVKAGDLRVPTFAKALRMKVSDGTPPSAMEAAEDLEEPANLPIALLGMKSLSPALTLAQVKELRASFGAE